MNRVLHPFAWWIWAGALAIAIAKASSVLLAVLTVGAVALVVRQKAEDAPWARSFQWSLRIGLWIIAIRTITGVLIGVPSAGRTIFTIPQLALPTWMAGIRVGGPVTLERVTATAHDGIIIAAIIALLSAAASLASPHRLLRSLPLMVYEFGVAVVIATSVLPQLVSSSHRIRLAQKLRGQSTRGMRGWRRLALPLLEDALARSLELAAAMDARGYGFKRRRSKYRATRWRFSEFAICLIGLVALKWPVLSLVAAFSALVLVKSQKTSATILPVNA